MSHGNARRGQSRNARRRTVSFSTAGLLVAVAGAFSSACGRSGFEELTFGGPIDVPDGGLFARGGSASAAGGRAAGASGGTGGPRGGAGGRSGSGGAGGRGDGGAAGGAGGTASTCERDSDCESPHHCAPARCRGSRCEITERDADGDGFIDAACGGDDCNDLNPSANPALTEACTDGADNDCNGVADCRDPACFGVACGCSPLSSSERCDNAIDDDCDGALDCNDPDCIGNVECGCEDAERRCGDGIDEDCDAAFDCDDTDCARDLLCECGSSPEICDNGEDDDCDLRIDCADPECAGRGPCACGPVSEPERCGDGADNDCDGFVDCADNDCLGSPDCRDCRPEICADGADNDCDGLIDCADPSCDFANECPPAPEQCNNDIDDDRDGSTDCLDPDCADNPLCAREQSSCLTARVVSASGTYAGDTFGHVSTAVGSCGGKAGEAVFRLVLNGPARVTLDTRGSDFDTVVYVRRGACGAGREIACDDDSGQQALAALVHFELLDAGSYFVFVDGFTIDPLGGPDEGAYVLNVDIDRSPEEVCADGRDNDGDGLSDCVDPDCTESPDCLECQGAEPELGPSRCTDGLDNDCDGRVDCEDDDCAASVLPSIECCDGLDDNDNGIADDFSCRCRTDADCIDGQLCYGTWIRACSIPCDEYVGDVCPVVAPGATCNRTTRQCEY